MSLRRRVHLKERVRGNEHDETTSLSEREKRELNQNKRKGDERSKRKTKVNLTCRS